MSDSGKIDELRSEFPDLLQARKEKRVIYPLGYFDPIAAPKWTGPFRLFSLPRELRDEIYAQLLIYNKPIQNYNRYRSIRACATLMIDISIFLTNRQIYTEALEVFCKHNEFSVGAEYGKRFSFGLRYFPIKPSLHVRRIRFSYNYQYGRPRWMPEGSESPFWTETIQDSNLAKEFFPKLQECRVSWFLRDQPKGLGVGFDEPRITNEQHARLWADWIWMGYRRDSKLLPPRCLVVDYDAGYGFRGFKDGLALFYRELGVPDVNDIEESGKKWLEEVSEVRKKKGKARAGRVAERRGEWLEKHM